MKHYYVLVLLSCPDSSGPFLTSISNVRCLSFFSLTFFSFFKKTVLKPASIKLIIFSWGRSWSSLQGLSNLKVVTADIAQLQLFCYLGGVVTLGQVHGAKHEWWPSLSQY